MPQDIFQRYSDYYDLLYRDKDYSAEAAYVARQLRAFNPGVHSVLEFGSGTGKHGQLLASQGFELVGIERSESMSATARSAATNLPPHGRGSFDCRQGDIRVVDAGRRFDAVISLFHVVSYQTHNSDVRQTFANSARHLVPQGLFLFDVWHGPAVLTQQPTVRVKRAEDERTRLIRIAEPELDMDAGIVTVRYTMLAEAKSDGRLTTFTEEHRMRYFFPTEIELLADQTGFNLLHSEEFLTARAPSEQTWE